MYFISPPFEFTCGEDLSRMQVKLGHLFQAAKCDLSDFFHCCDATDALRKYFGLKGIPAALLREVGVDVPADCVDSRAYTFPRLDTLPIGFGPSPGIAQAAHEAVLYGKEGTGSDRARQLAPVVRPAARWSRQRVPDVDSPEASAPHALIIDDLLLFRQVPCVYVDADVNVDHDTDEMGDRLECLDEEVTRDGPGGRSGEEGTALASVLTRYDEVGLRTKPSKVRDYAAVQDMLGHIPWTITSFGARAHGTLRSAPRFYE